MTASKGNYAHVNTIDPTKGRAITMGKAIYWISTALFCLFYASGAFFYLTQRRSVVSLCAGRSYFEGIAVSFLNRVRKYKDSTLVQYILCAGIIGTGLLAVTAVAGNATPKDTSVSHVSQYSTLEGR